MAPRPLHVKEWQNKRLLSRAPRPIGRGTEGHWHFVPSAIVRLGHIYGREPNSATALASQLAASHSLSFFTIIVFYDLVLRPICWTVCRKLRPNLALVILKVFPKHIF